MNKPQRGFLVVLKSLRSGETIYNPNYKGIDRTPPFSLEEYEMGFNDPYLGGKYVNPDGLIPNLQLASQALVDFSKIEPAENLEIIFVQEWSKGQIEKEHTFNLLGYDIATDRPFWSIVNDSPSLTNPHFSGFLNALNKNGLFNSPQLAEEYLKTYILHIKKDQVSDLKIWVIFQT